MATGGRTTDATDWRQVFALYDHLLALAPTPVAARGMTGGSRTRRRWAVDPPTGHTPDVRGRIIPSMTDTHWPDYYAVTVDRPAWQTVTEAIRLFAAEDGPGAPPRLAVDLGCGAGRDARELLRHGWRVLAVDREGAAIEALAGVTPDEDRLRLETRVADLAAFEIPACDLVNASVSLQFLDAGAYARAFERVTTALAPGGRFTGLLYGDRDEAASDPAMTCPSPDAMRGFLDGFEIESWTEKEEDGKMALGDPHHIHLVEVVARRLGASG